MTAKLVALYKKPADTQAFDEYYFNVHAPLAEKMPGLREAEYRKVTWQSPGPEYYLIAELTFDSMEALQAAVNSSEGKAAGKDIMGFAGDLLQMVFVDTAKKPVEAH